MTNQEYWNKLSAKNPNLKCDMVRISSEKLKAISDQAWEEGRKSVAKPPKSKPFNNMFNSGCKEFDDIFNN